jgi:hypothetical protein
MSDKPKKSVLKRWWFWVGLVIVFIIIGASSQDGNQGGRSSPAQTGTDTQKTTQEAPRPQAPRPTSAQERTVAKVGEQISVANFTYRVSHVAFKKTVGNEFTSETADGIFLIVDLSLMNTSDKTRTLDNSMFKLVNESGIEYASSTNGSTALELSGTETLFLKQCQPNIQTSGALIFEVPSSTDRYTLKVSGGFWTFGSIDVYA